MDNELSSIILTLILLLAFSGYVIVDYVENIPYIEYYLLTSNQTIFCKTSSWNMLSDCFDGTIYQGVSYQDTRRIWTEKDLKIMINNKTINNKTMEVK